MSDNDQQSVPDLFEGSDTTDTSADAGATDENAELLNGKETQIETPVKEKQTADSPAEVQRRKQVDHWVTEISQGRKNLSDLPADKQWLKVGIESGLKSVTVSDDEIDRRLDDKLKKKEEERTFKLLNDNLKSMKLKGSQRSTVQEEFADNISLGMSQAKALEKAMKVAGIPLDPEDQDRMILRQRMSLPVQGSNHIVDSDTKPEDPDFHKKVRNPKEKMRILMEHMRS